MHSKLAANYFALAALSVCLSGCDALVSTDYRGESRLSLAMRIENSVTSSTDSVVPALAHLDAEKMRFRAVETRGSFPADFRMFLFDPPDDERLAPINPWLAPDIIVAQEYVAAVIEYRLGEPLELSSRFEPISRDCWNGNCDIQPTPASAPKSCANSDRACIERQRDCPYGRCPEPTRGVPLPEGIEDLAGFDQEHMLLYVQTPVPAHSWAALRLGAPEGLDPGYHLVEMREHSRADDMAFDICIGAAREGTVERFNAEHETAYTDRDFQCLEEPEFFHCEGRDLPTGEVSRELASAIAAAELELGCYEIAPELQAVADPSAKRITVRMGKGPPRWAPSTMPRRTPIAGVEP